MYNTTVSNNSRRYKTPEEILKVIHDNCLSVRRIVTEDWHTYEMSHYREGDEIVVRTIDQVHPDFKSSFAKQFPNGRQFCRRRVLHDTDGHYMVQENKGRGSTQTWDYQRDFGAATLEASISLYLASKSSVH